MNKIHYNVSGLINNEKKTQVKNALDKIEGVQMVNVDVARGSIEVGYGKGADQDSISDCIQNVGCTII